jgi:hypothetical protein
MPNPVTDVELALTVMAEAHQDLPILAQGLLDLKEAYADKADPAKLAVDFQKFISDNEGLLNNLLKLAPAAK